MIKIIFLFFCCLVFVERNNIFNKKEAVCGSPFPSVHLQIFPIKVNVLKW
jgi:hypothetical protein